MKCDETFPVCCRCLSTGRKCDGYGIWGGGTGDLSANWHRQPCNVPTNRTATASPTLPYPALVSLAVASSAEQEHFQWFQVRTGIKMQGSFYSDFWSTLLLQASFGEPAIFHAVLSLSSVHKHGVLNSNRGGEDNGIHHKAEQFALHHYVEAIGHLRRHLGGGHSMSSCRIALITCVVFVSLEFLRGHFAAARVHLHNGLKLLRQTYSGPVSSLSAADEWIIEVFNRLYVQVRLFDQRSLHMYRPPFLQPRAVCSQSPVFSCVKEAWQEIEQLLEDVFLLSRRAQQLQSDNTADHPSATLLAGQQRIREGLEQWLAKFEASTCPTRHPQPSVDPRPWPLVRCYHTMATIMTEVALRPGDEVVYDSHTGRFAHLIEISIELKKASSEWLSAPEHSGPHFDMSRSIIDLGWIPPLFYTATKCRVRRIRLQAIRLLESAPHREGIWDARILVRVARRVMELEENDVCTDDDDPISAFALDSRPREQDLALPTVPESRRIREVVISFSDESDRMVTLQVTYSPGRQLEESIIID